MAKFCTNCGKPLPESGICDCQTAAEEPVAGAAVSEPVQQAAPAEAAMEQPQNAQAEESAQQPFTAAPNQESAFAQKAKQLAGEVVPFVKGYFANPAGTTVKMLQENNLKMAITVMVLHVIFAGLMVLTTLSKLMGSVGKGLGSAFGKVDISVPFFASFFGGVVIAILGLGLSMLALFALLRMVKIKMNFRHMVVAVGVNALLCTGFTVLAWLLMLVGLIKLSLAVLLMGCVFWCIMGLVIATKVFGASPTGVLVLLYTLLFTVVLCLTMWLGSKLVIGAVGKVEIEGTSISDMMEEVGSLDADSLFRGLFG